MSRRSNIFIQIVFLKNRKRPERLILQAFQPFIEQGMRESNSRQRFWRPLSYHLTNPLYIKYYEGFYPHILYTFIFCFSILFSFVPSKLHTDLTNQTLLSKNGHLDFFFRNFRKPVTSKTSFSQCLLKSKVQLVPERLR